jgi:transaldolase/glucose-6-phosphate isomerase
MLKEYGQTVWLDFIQRGLITTGELRRFVEEDGLGGVTSNPAIFEKAITGSADYADILETLQQKKGMDATAIYEYLAIRDIQDAANVLMPVYEKTNRRDGYVCLEVSPFLAHETQGTIDEARRLWNVVGRQNVMVKVPATSEGIPAIEQLISEGINVNVTLLFSREIYERVTQAYINGLEKLASRGGDVRTIASVASFFVSRIDTLLDSIIEARVKTSTHANEQALLQGIMGKVAIANARLTYQRYKEIFRGDRWQKLAEKGAQTQRVLWASTSTKNPKYRDVTYVEELVGPDTVNTMPLSTIEAFRDHGRPRASLEESIEAAHNTMKTLEQLDISMKECTDNLLREGVRLFADAFDKLLNALDTRCKKVSSAKVNLQTYTLPDDILVKVKTTIEDWKINGKTRRLWAQDASLWTRTDEGNWLGWLDVIESELKNSQQLQDIADEVKRAGFSHALLLGMGGSSLCPEVLKMTFGKVKGYPEFHVLDSTDPAQIKALEDNVDLANTLFIVSSKSGTTLEPNIFKQYYFEKVRQIVCNGKTLIAEYLTNKCQKKQIASSGNAGDCFIAITDPGSKLQKVAEGDGFRHIFFGVPGIGGRYSALSAFGMAPAAIMGIDVRKLLNRASDMVISCSPCLPAEDNPGVVLGVILGVLAHKKRDKVTIITSPGIRDFGAWLEQLLAESTGKEGRGLVPVDREPLGSPDVYSNDRVFIYIRLDSAPDESQDEAVNALEQVGHPVVRISIGDLYDIAQEFFRWEVATAVAGSIIGINPFNQPDVETSKAETRKLTAEYEKTGSLPQETPIFEGSGIKLFTNEENVASLTQLAGRDKSLVHYLSAHLNRIKAGDYFALLAYIEMNEANEERLQSIRQAVRDRKHVATCLGFGPRFLHSTGQAYKGGPNSGVFLQITCDDATDLAVPGQKYTFGVVKTAQARGDFQVLAERDRRVLRVHLDAHVQAGLDTLLSAVKQALK